MPDLELICFEWYIDSIINLPEYERKQCLLHSKRPGLLKLFEYLCRLKRCTFRLLLHVG